MSTISSKLRMALLWLPVALSVWAIADTVMFIYQRFGNWIIPDSLLWQLLFLSFMPIVYWSAKPTLLRKVYLVCAGSLVAFYLIGLIAVAITVYRESYITGI